MKNEIAKAMIIAGMILQLFPFVLNVNDDLTLRIHVILIGVSAIGVLLLLLSDKDTNKGKKFKKELSDTEYMSITKEEIEALIKKENDQKINEQGGN